MANLLEKNLIYISGKKKAIGTPNLYEVTEDFYSYLNITEKSAKKNFSKKETNTGLKIFIALASFLIALISFPLIFIFGPFWVAIYLSLSTSIMYAFFSKDLED